MAAAVGIVAVALGGPARGQGAATSAPPAAAVLVGAGDIASCSSKGDEATAALLDSISGTVFTTGDNAYPSGRARDFARCYTASWGRHKRRTRPAPGNHDYRTKDARGYFDYFGGRAGHRNRGYYSYDLAGWHIVVLNSNLPMERGSPQEAWLRKDLAAWPARCTLAYWHHPLFSSGTEHGGQEAARPLWDALYDAGADVVLGGHEHNYERFAPQTPAGVLDTARGIRQFVVGTGGDALYEDAGDWTANSEVFSGTTHGVLKLTLLAGSYEWEFVPVAGGSFRDAGRDRCK